MKGNSKDVGRLVITRQEGESFYLNDVEVEVVKIIDPQTFKIKVIGAMDAIMTIGVDSKAELIPNVFASAGTNKDGDQVRIVIEAPKSVKILRKELYEETHR